MDVFLLHYSQHFSTNVEGNSIEEAVAVGEAVVGAATELAARSRCLLITSCSQSVDVGRTTVTVAGNWAKRDLRDMGNRRELGRFGVQELEPEKKNCRSWAARQRNRASSLSTASLLLCL